MVYGAATARVGPHFRANCDLVQESPSPTRISGTRKKMTLVQWEYVLQ